MLSLPKGTEQKTSNPLIREACQTTEHCITISTKVEIDTNPRVEEVRVDMAEMKVESKPVELLTSVGSCVAICMFDSKHKCGGLAHIMLPRSATGPQEPLPSKFADTAVPALAKSIHQEIGSESRLVAKIAGGANMFANLGVSLLDIGGKNVNAVKESLKTHNIKLASEDVGGLHGRKITFNFVSGMVTIRNFNGDVKNI